MYHPASDFLSGVSGIILCDPQPGVESNYAYFPVVFDGYKYTRDEIHGKLKAQDIVARKYFYPLTSDFACYRDFPTAGGDKTPVAKRMADCVLTLPLYPDLPLCEVERICRIILN